jgi:1-phosphofructokinase family hexose kinase
MILCVCAGPALDLTYRVDRLEVGSTNRVREVRQRPGGKAINVARLLHLLGEDVHLLTTAGGDSGASLAAGLRDDGIPHELVPSAAPTRRTVAIVDAALGEVTMLNEPAVLEDWGAFRSASEALIPPADVVVISGRLPAGPPPDAFAQLIAIAAAKDIPVVLDTSGPPLLAALAARPRFVKPNAEELRECSPEADPLLAARSVALRWQVTVVASLGADGLVATDGVTAWRARPADALTGNPTGAGDAVVAGLARGLRAGTAIEPLLSDCVALAAAAVLAPSAGELDVQHYQREATGVVVELIDPVRR